MERLIAAYLPDDVTPLVLVYVWEAFKKDGAIQDIRRYSTMHSWYKHLDLVGQTFYMFPGKNPQPSGYESLFRYEHVSDGKHHWYLLPDSERFKGKEVVNIVRAHCVKLNQFFYGNYHGMLGDSLRTCAQSRDGKGYAWLQDNYPQQMHSLSQSCVVEGCDNTRISLQTTHDSIWDDMYAHHSSPILQIHHFEYLRMETLLLEQMKQVWNKLQNLTLDPLATEFLPRK
jgi:hypothetical protein